MLLNKLSETKRSHVASEILTLVFMTRPAPLHKTQVYRDGTGDSRELWDEMSAQLFVCVSLALDILLNKTAVHQRETGVKDAGVEGGDVCLPFLCRRFISHSNYSTIKSNGEVSRSWNVKTKMD